MNEGFSDFIENNAIVVFDTNVYLNLYEYSPEVADKYIEAINFIEEYIYMPNTVYREFLRNHNQCRGRQKKKFRNVPNELKKLTYKLREQLNKQLNILEKFKFPKIEELKNESLNKVSDVESTFEKYLKEDDVYEVINNKFLEKDKIYDLVNNIVQDLRVFKEPTLDDIYKICQEGENRYLKKIPPGFKDAKNKDGIDKYNDLIIWKEVLKYCKNNNKNVIFVTDDVKEDWWEKDGENLKFHSSLVEEFIEVTGKNILPLNSQQLFEALGELYEISIPDTIQTVLKYSEKKYVSELYKRSDLIYDIQSEVVNSGELYVNTDTLSCYDGSYFEMDDEFNNIELLDYELEDYEDGIAKYIIELELSVKAKSRNYCGRDEDTREVILSPNYYIHDLKGKATIEVAREVDFDNIDEIVSEVNYSEVNISELQLEEVQYIYSDDLCIECHQRIGTQPYGDTGEMLCDVCAEVQDEYGFICPGCGFKKPYSDSAGNGYCIECTNASDYL